MPTLRIQFPEKDSPSTLTLSGNRITIGRRADNTVQIVDRMISAFHAELIQEGDHYRLHDLGSTNGTRVNGEVVEDFHLREACKIGFGTVECDFSPETPAAGGEALPTRIEVDAVRKENDTLKSRLTVLEEEVTNLKKLQDASGGDASTDLTKTELQRMIQERAEMQEASQKQIRDFTALKTELARVNRDRQNLQDALSQAQAELAHLKEQASPVAKPTEPAKVPEPQSAAPSAPAVTPAATAPAATPAPAAPTAKPTVAPVGLPKPTSVGSAPAPAAPAGAPPASVPRPSAPAAPSAPSAPGLRPVARPAVAAQAPGAPRAVPVPKATPKPVGAGPSGTQKIAIPASGQPPVPVQATRPIAKPTGLPKLGSLPKPTAVPVNSSESASE